MRIKKDWKKLEQHINELQDSFKGPNAHITEVSKEVGGQKLFK